MKFKVPESLYFKLDNPAGEYISVTNAINVIRQRFPTYSAQNLYTAARTLDSDGKVQLETVLIPAISRIVIPREAFERWLKNPDLGKVSQRRKKQ